MQMNKSTLTAYQDRWKVVAAMEVAELRQTSATERWQKLNAIVRMAAELGIWPKENSEQVTVVHHRWNRLKSLYLAQQKDNTP